MAAIDSAAPLDFIRQMISEDVKTGKNQGRVVTRFPPEPNGYLHIGHAKSICLNFGVAQEFGGICNLRFDDTNPTKEEMEYVESIKADVRWLGFDWHDRLYYASDYFEELYQYALKLLETGKAYVCSLSPEEIREHRGTLTEPGKNSPYRERSPAENLDLFTRMRAGEFPEGAHVLRAKIDMASPNLNLRDPVLYRTLHAEHHRTGDRWCLYPMYDYAHPVSDALEGITHSLCTLEFEDHRPLYDWILDELLVPCHPQQIEFARLNLTYTVMSKRKLLGLVQEGHVGGWDDPRMPTISGMRRRGYTPEAIRHFCDLIGVGRRENLVELSLLEYCVREDLNRRAPRVMGVLRPLKVVLLNYPEGRVEEVEAVNNPEDPALGTRGCPSPGCSIWSGRTSWRTRPRSSTAWPPAGKCVCATPTSSNASGVVKDPHNGEVVELHCTYDPETRGGYAPDGRQVKATLHWVSAAHALKAEVRLYDRLFAVSNPGAAKDADLKETLNPHSLEILTDCRVEPSLGVALAGDRCQFERLGYFCVDPDAAPGSPVFNRTVSLRDPWAKILQTGTRGRP